MALFKTILCKLLYPKNTNEEICDTFVLKPTPFVEIFTANAQYKNIVSIFKNPKYKDFLFYLANHFLFYTNTDEPISGVKSIYATVAIKYKFLKKNMTTFAQYTFDDFVDMFSDIQKHYLAFARFANIWKHKRSHVQIEHDLYMTLLDRNNRNVFSLLQQGKIYLFTTANLVNTICTSLSNCPDFFVEPLVIKNPYNNIPLTKSDLYNIYFFLKQSPIIMPVLFHNYFLVDFDLRKFCNENENVIKHMAFKSHVRNASVTTLYFSIINMLKKYQKKIVIHKDFPKELLVSIMRPYLLLYYITEYSSEEYRTINAEEILKYKLKRLYKHNCAFGRKIVKLKREGFSKKRTRYIEFSNNHPNFDEPVDMEVYQKTHTEIVETDYSSSEEENTNTIYNTNRVSRNNNNTLPFVIISPQPSLAVSHNVFAVIYNTTTNTSDTTIVRESDSEEDSDDHDDDDEQNTEEIEYNDNEIVVEGDSDSEQEESDEDN
uniref:Uncharacterized protein n=1 Tax=viral metagenome TaxID=1070528 RepID=A0A6C0HI79_9ZZZZ